MTQIESYQQKMVNIGVIKMVYVSFFVQFFPRKYALLQCIINMSEIR